MSKKDLIIGGLRGADLAAFLLMLENGSAVESIQDEFGFQQSEVKAYSEKARSEAESVGGLSRLRDMVEPTPIQAGAQKGPNPNGISKTSVGLRDALFKTMEDLMAGNIDPADAIAVCGVSKAICDTVKLEMDAERLMATNGSRKDGPRVLKLGKDADY